MARNTLPKNLNEATAFFQKEWTTRELDNFKNMPENEAVTKLHFGMGLWIRNNWVYGNRDTALTNYFNSLGIYHPDDISSIILTSLHRILNQKDIQLNKQIESYKDYWRPFFECDKRLKAQAVSNYNKFKEGDIITIYMPVDTSYGNRNAVFYDCPKTDWTFTAAMDLVVEGTIVKKYFINDTANVFFTIRINYMNLNDVPILMEKVRTGETKNLSLRGLTIK